MIKAIIFDLDGTLANTLPLCIAAFRKSVEPLLHRSVSDEEIIATFGPSEEGTIMALAPTHYEKGVRDYLQFYEGLHSMCPDTFSGIKALLASLAAQSIRLAMVTGKGAVSTEISLKQFGILHFFEYIETGSPQGPRKADGIRNILRHWKDIDKETVWYVGDAPGDIVASREAGIPVVAAAWAGTADLEKLKAQQPDILFDNIPDFVDWLNTMIH
jgi:phosphoglycolate phosphatase/pyrophosphatase PpaX